MTSTEQLGIARAHANRMRGDWLLSISEGIQTPAELIAQAAEPGFEPLRAIALSRLLSAQPTCGAAKANRIVSALTSVNGADKAPVRPSVGWLVDRRSGGKRLIAFANLIRPNGPPWPGFPFTPKPQRGVEK